MKLQSLLLAGALSLGANSAFAQITPAQPLTVTQSSTVAGTPTTFTAQLTSVVPTYTSTGNNVTGAYLDLILPAGYTVGSISLAQCATITITAAPAAAVAPVECGRTAVTAATSVASPLPAYPTGTKIFLLLPNTPITQNQTVTVTIPSGIITATTSGPKNIRLDQTDQLSNPEGLQRSEGTITIAAPAAPVPTLSEWAMILLGMILAGGAALVIQRRQLGV